MGDRWCGDSPLCDAFLSLSVLALARKGSLGGGGGGGGGIFGVLNKVGDVGTLPSLGCLMTGNWRMCQDSCFI